MIHRLNVLLASLWLMLAPAFAQMGQNPGWPVVQPPPAGGAFSGPGDLTIAATTVAWGGFSCYKASAPTARAVRLINETTTTQADINCNTATGIDLTAVASLGCGSAVCKVVEVYDQTGLTNCFGSIACDVSSGSTDSIRPTYAATGGAGGKPCATWATTNTLNSAALITSLATFSLATVSTNTSASFGGVITFATSLDGYYYSSTADTVALFAGSFTSNVAATFASFHSLTGVLNGASSIIGVDGTSTTGLSAGTNASGANPIIWGDTTNQYTGTSCEFWIMSGTLTTGNITSISSNAHTRYGF